MNLTSTLLACALLSVSIGGRDPGETFEPARGETGIQSDEKAAPRKAVLVTGASSGIGRRTTEVLAENGYFVYAGARKDSDLAALNELKNVEAVRLDVTSASDIAAAVLQVEKGGRGLYGLINNAGVLVMAPMIEVTEEDLDFQMNVNVRGPYRVTKAFAPLLIESKGRVMTTGSISGFVTWGFGGPYTMSKHAVEAMNDCLATELGPLGVRVSVVDPGNFKSRITTNMIERMKSRGYCGEGSYFEGRLDGIMKGTGERDQFDAPDRVAETFLAALDSDTPKRRYMVTPNQREADMTLAAALRRVAEINGGHEFSHSRESLHKMLDRALDQND